MGIQNWRDNISAILGEPTFNGNRIWVWQSKELEFSYCLNFNGGFAVFVYKREEKKNFDFYYNDFEDVRKSAKHYSKYFEAKKE